MANLGNVPSITNASHSHTTYDGTGAAMGMGLASAGTGFINAVNISPVRLAMNQHQYQHQQQKEDGPFVQAIRELQAERQQEKQVAKSTRRLVKVIIIDTDENVPLTKCVLYSGDEKLTDATDQELFFEIDIKNILDKHNEYRVTLKDKSVKERVENLEPVKIRDLRMVVVNVATF
jgi:hypothetical protein